MHRRSRLPVLALAAFLLPSSAKVGQLPISSQPLDLRAEAVLLVKDRPDQIDAGQLRYLGGWVLRAAHPDFGGWSGMMATPGGLRLVSDAGGVLDIQQPGSAQMTARISELPKGCGRHWNKEMQDAEAVTADPVSGQWWISLEKTNLICRIASSNAVTVAARPEMAGWSSALGGEAMLRLRDGRFLVFAEADPHQVHRPSPVYLFEGDPVDPATRSRVMHFSAPAGFRPIESVQLPDGGILVLLRSFAFPVRWRSRIIRLELSALRDGAVLEGQDIARLGPPQITDNFEAMAVTQEKRRTILWLASDDNFWPLQQTYLLKFAVKD